MFDEMPTLLVNGTHSREGCDDAYVFTIFPQSLNGFGPAAIDPARSQSQERAYASDGACGKQWELNAVS